MKSRGGLFQAESWQVWRPQTRRGGVCEKRRPMGWSSEGGERGVGWGWRKARTHHVGHLAFKANKKGEIWLFSFNGALKKNQNKTRDLGLKSPHLCKYNYMVTAVQLLFLLFSILCNIYLFIFLLVIIRYGLTSF